MSSVSVEDRLLAYKNQSDWWFDKLLLLAICTVAWSLIAIRPPTGEAINVFHGGSSLDLNLFVFGGNGPGRIAGNFFAFTLTWNPLGLIQPGQLILVGVLGMFIWHVLASEPVWARAGLAGLFVFGFPYLTNGMDRPWACIFGPTAIMFVAFLYQIARGNQTSAVSYISIACLVVLTALSYETWMMFFVGVSLVAIGAKLAPGLGGRLQIYNMSNRQVFAIGFPLAGCLLLAVFFPAGRGALPTSGVALSVSPKLTILTARILLNIVVDSLPIGAIIGFGVTRSTSPPAFSKMGLWPYLLVGLIFATVSVNFVYGLVMGGVIDWRSRFLIILMLTAFYLSLPWGSISKWLRARTGLYFDNAVRIAMAAAIIKLVYTVVLTFMMHPLNLVGWVDYRARILAKDASVLEELTDFGSCDSKYCFTEYRSGGTHALAIEYWADGTAAYVVPWLRIAALRID